MFDLRSFGLTDILECSFALRRCGGDGSSMEEAAGAVVDYLYSHLVDKETDAPALSLVRLYKTHRFAELEPDLRAFVESVSPGRPVAPDAPCLVLLASAGEDPDWNDRRRSRRHRAIPLHDAAAVEALPMVYQLASQLGLREAVVRPDPALFHAAAGQPGGVFYVPEAAGSEVVPDQKGFVEPYGIRSVVGFGGVLPSGYAFTVVMFTKVPVSREVAEAFAPLAHATQLALLPFVESRLFASDPAPTGLDLERDLRLARAEATALSHLLETRHQVVADQARRLEQAHQEAEDRAAALARSQRRLAASEATKAAIVNAALDAIITMDGDGLIVDFNPAAETIFGYRREEAVGRPLADLVVPPHLRAAHTAGLQRYVATGEGRIIGRRIEITAVRADGTEFPVELAIAAVDAAGPQLFSGHIRDISARVRTEEALRAAGRRYADIARRLQASLLPPELPVIPGVDLASSYNPGAEGLDVGGDFYDVFEVGGGRWGIVLGDVMGKGADAAAITALARHTVRAAAIRTTEPAAVLHLLNEALYRHEPDRFCTVVFAFLEGEAGRRQLRLACGGHPLPLLRRANGDSDGDGASAGAGTGVTAVGAPAPLLGPFPDWHGATAVVALEPGDLVLFYSDGVTEARAGREEFGLDRLAATLTAAKSADAAETVGAVISAVAAFATTPADDVATLALQISG